MDCFLHKRTSLLLPACMRYRVVYYSLSRGEQSCVVNPWIIDMKKCMYIARVENMDSLCVSRDLLVFPCTAY